jgi:hypothetical protein
LFALGFGQVETELAKKYGRLHNIIPLTRVAQKKINQATSV